MPGRLRDFAVRAVTRLGITALRNERWAARVDSLVRSARFAHGPMAGAERCAGPEALLRLALEKAPGEGLVLEFGVYRGASLRRISRELVTLGRPGTVVGFDWFHGLPETWTPDQPKGMYAVREPPTFRPPIELVEGLFQDTLLPFLRGRPGPVSFLHLDADLYSSTRFVLETLEQEQRLAPGTVIQFDEIYNYVGWWQDGEYRAWREFLEAHHWNAEYLGYVASNKQVAVRLVSKDRQGPAETPVATVAGSSRGPGSVPG
jgi:hypothetical protein